MTAPRRLLPRQTHFVTRRTTRRTFLLRPTKTVNQIVLYALGVAQLRAPEVELHGSFFEANHHHTNNTDASGESQLPVFYHQLHSLIARALNAHFGRGENFWSQPGSYDNVEVEAGDTETLEDQLLYLWTQSVKDGLTARPEDWPGVKFLPEAFGTTITVDRPPTAFFGGRRPSDWEPTYPPAQREVRRAERRLAQERRRRQKRRARNRAPGRGKSCQHRRRPQPVRPPRRRDTLPEQVTIRISPPPGYEHLSLAEVRAHFRSLLEERIAAIHVEREAEGLTHFMGAEAVSEQSPFESAGDTFPTFALNPRLAPGRLLEPRLDRIRGLQAWRGSYREALEKWREGDREVCFPIGSYWIIYFHKARVAPSTGPPAR